MENDSVTLALIAIIPAIIVGVGAPALTVWLQNRAKRVEKSQEIESRRLEKEQDWRRQDEVAARAAEASRKMLANQEASISAIESSSQAAATAAVEASAQATAIHTLVNSNTDAMLRAELESTRRELVALIEIMEIKRSTGMQPTATALSVISVAERRISELETTLADRRNSTELAKAQLEDGKIDGKIAAAVKEASKPAAERAARKVVPPVVIDVVPPVVKAAVKEALNDHDKDKSR